MPLTKLFLGVLPEYAVIPNPASPVTMPIIYPWSIAGRHTQVIASLTSLPFLSLVNPSSWNPSRMKPIIHVHWTWSGPPCPWAGISARLCDTLKRSGQWVREIGRGTQSGDHRIHASTQWIFSPMKFFFHILICLLPLGLFFLPEGTEVLQGGATHSTVGKEMTIRAPEGSILRHKRFNLASDETIRFEQPTTESRALNRITDSAPSRIDGRIEANGRVYIVNPAGVVFGSGSTVEAGRLHHWRPLFR